MPNKLVRVPDKNLGMKVVKIKSIPPDWGTVRIKDIADVNKKNLSSNTRGDYSFYYIELNAVSEGQVRFPETKMIFKKSPSRARRIPSAGDILMSTVRPNLMGFAVINFNAKDVICSTGFAVITPKVESDTEFIYQSLYSEATRKQLYRLLVGSNYPAINNIDVEHLWLTYPLSEKERFRISEILVAWDKFIEKTTKLIKLKTKLKKALMQKLFRGLPHKEINIITEQISVRNYEEACMRILSVTNDRGFVLPEEQFDRRVASDNLKNYKAIKQGQYAYNPSRINVGSIARLDKWGEGVLSPMYVVFKLNEKIVISDYFLHWLSSYEARERIKRSAQGSVRETVSFDMFGAILMPLPDVKVQDRIAQILNCISKEIDVLYKLVDLYRTQKQGLMQKLLTGKIRVKGVTQ